MSVLKKVTKEDIAVAKADATAQYNGRLEGYSEDFAAGADHHGNYPRRFFRGNILEFPVLGVDALLQLVTGKLAEGWKMSAVPTSQVGAAYNVYLAKPDAEIADDLKLEHAEAEAALKLAVDKENDAIVAAQVALRKADVIRQREQEALKADQQLEAELLAEVRAALGVK